MLSFALGLLLSTRPDNVLLIIADDLGTESLEVYGAGPPEAQPPTPNISALAARGMTFSRAYAHPVCSSSRASMYTGRHPFRHGIGNIVHPRDEAALPLEEITIAERLGPAGIHCSLIGKWHLGMGTPRRPGSPVAHGWDSFTGTRGNVSNYFGYFWLRRGEVDASGPANGYITTKVTNEALRAMGEMPEPWFLTVAYHAPHKPVHTPPLRLHSYGLPRDEQEQYLAMIEALDTELGRLLANVDPLDTTILFVGDNGMVGEFAHFVENEVPLGKASPFEYGSRIPLIIAGKPVSKPGSHTDAFVQCGRRRESAGIWRCAREALWFLVPRSRLTGWHWLLVPGCPVRGRQ